MPARTAEADPDRTRSAARRNSCPPVACRPPGDQGGLDHLGPQPGAGMTQTQPAKAAAADLLRGLDGILPGLRDLYKDLHEHPELSFQEVRTAGIVAERLRASGWGLTEGLGGPEGGRGPRVGGV